MVPDQAGWTREALLFADMVDLLNVLAWQQTENGHKGRNPPDRVPRPGVAPPKRDGSNPKAAPLSVVKRRMAERHASTAPKNTSPARQDRVQRINNLFSGGR
nr:MULTISPECIES: DUF5361 domain-containing protein [unclassified Mycolicibacterium]